MPKLIVSIDGVVIKEVTLTKDRTSLGRRPYNDVVIDNLAISGEHAAVHLHGDDVEVEDLGSTNGTFLNGQPIKRQRLHNGDVVDIGKYKIRFVHEGQQPSFEKTMIFKPGQLPTALRAATASSASASTSAPALQASIKVLSGAAAGREVELVKIVTTIGKPGMAVASITRRPHNYVLTHVEGEQITVLNGQPIGTEPVALQSGDVLDLAGTQMQFLQR